MSVNIALVLLLFLAGPSIAEAGIESLIPKGVNWSLAVRPLAPQPDKGSEKQVSDVWQAGEHQPNQPLAPGSLMKLLISGPVLAAGLELPTRLSRDQTGNLYLKGSGNVLLTTDELAAAVNELSRKELTNFAGDLIVDDSLLENKGLERARKGAAYALPGALGLDLHTVALTVSPGRQGEAPEATVSPTNATVRMAISAWTVASGGNTLRLTQLDDLAYKVTGNIPENSGPVKVRFALADPALYAGQTLKTLLGRQGIVVTGSVRRGKTPEAAELLAVIPGPALATLLRDMNFHSLNVAADTLLLRLGVKPEGEPGTREKGLQVVRGFLQELGLPLDELRIADGSGMGEGNRVSANLMTRYLCALADRPWFDDFRTTLPRPGVEGTVRGITVNAPGFRVKSGQLEDVYALAGYGVDAAGGEIAFTFILNGPGVGMRPDLETIGAGVLHAIAAKLVH